jgi:epoxyqueuosine reductase
MTLMDEDLKKFIEGQGWTMYGVIGREAACRALLTHEKVFDKWVRVGFDAEMDYLKRMEGDRYHPERVLDDLKSVIVLGAWYAEGGPGRLFAEQKNCSSKCGKVARYAAGRDYHKVLKKKLVTLSDWLKNQGSGRQGAEVKTYTSVDSGPTVDRVLAEAAGLGFFGKNTCLIDPRKGSYFFIASVLTDLELTPTDRPHMPSCGDCKKCLESCPTGALVEPGKLDARKCISYLTIENKGGIPEDLRPAVGDRLFGCDACQEVCPFNVGRAHRQAVEIDHLKGEFGVGKCLDLKEVLSIRTDGEFLKRFAGTPLMRAKRRGILRNACVVAGNSGNPDLVPHLQDLIDHEKDDMLIEHAAWATRQLKY